MRQNMKNKTQKTIRFITIFSLIIGTITILSLLYWLYAAITPEPEKHPSGTTLNREGMAGMYCFLGPIPAGIITGIIGLVTYLRGRREQQNPHELRKLFIGTVLCLSSGLLGVIMLIMD